MLVCDGTRKIGAGVDMGTHIQFIFKIFQTGHTIYFDLNEIQKIMFFLSTTSVGKVKVKFSAK